MAVHRRFPSNLLELERCCKEKWAKLPKDSRPRWEPAEEREIPDTWWLFLHKSLQLVSGAHSRPASCASSTAPLAHTEVTWTDISLLKV
ncbi:hypothetical protein L3Q82_000740 [Scortum barcoo]|uniref:Uncharacterized protein n=1 Tax=Scortum barcoo TaxID=214431 RepID=A0ACB8WDV6_9TELE|nr:hypothetical protein L3Q82_000740 [Scortum barcoo]